MMRALKIVVGVSGMLLVTGAAETLAAPLSDGSIFYETFTNYPEDPKSSGPGTGVDTSGGAAVIVTTTETDGIFRASPLGISGGTEYVVEYDATVNGPSGNNFWLYFSEGSGSPWNSDIDLRVFEDGSNWGFQVDYGAGQWQQFLGYTYGQTYHMTIHHKTDDTIDVYMDGDLLGNYADRNAGLGTNLIQFGEGSASAGYGDMTIDNVSIGAAVPEPASLGLISIGGAALALRRRR